MRKKCDIAVIGAGPGGYVAAIKASQSGKKVVLIEKGAVGGSCLNCGCIPTKTLLANAEVLSKVRRAGEYGIHVEGVSFDFKAMKQRKDSVVSGIVSSLEGLIKANQIEIVHGLARFISPKELRVSEDTIIEADKIIIATGSKPMEIGAFPCDHDRIRDSTSMLELDYVPKTLTVIGGGYIGSEFASLYAELGCKVTIVEALPAIVAAQGKDVSDTLAKAFKKRGIEILTSTALEKMERRKEKVHLQLSNGQNLESDMVLMSVGRSVVSDNLDLSQAGVGTDQKGFIKVNERMETSVAGIYAIGDVTGKAMLAHVASHQGIVAAVNATGGYANMHYHAIPAIIFTHPEIAMVGLNFEEAQARGYAPERAKFPFQHHGKAIAAIETDGFAQIIVDKTTGQILGAQVIGEGAANMIGEMAVAIQNELTIECIADTVHAHPTMAEGWLEAALLASGSPIHFPPKARK